MPLARVGGIELSYERSGSGPPLLAIMGMSGTFSHWQATFLQELRESFEVIVYDHRGVGESTRLEGPLTILDLAADAAGLLDALEVDRAHVLGISMGGMIAQELALAHPQRVPSLVLGCTYCGGEGSALASPEVIASLVDAMRTGERETAVRASWEVNVSPAFAADERAWEAFRAIGVRRAVAAPVIRAQMQAIAAHDTSARLSALQLPTLIVHGAVDRLIPVQNAHAIAGHLPHAQLEILDGVGHLFMWEEPHGSAVLVQDHALVHA